MASTVTETERESALSFKTARAWATWLHKHHADSTGIWMRLARKGQGGASLTHAEALELALCYGWIDGRKKSEDAGHWLQRFTPRAARSIWSKVNREKALALIEAGRMQPAGLAEVERAQRDGRWEAAYDSYRSAEPPQDLREALAANPKAQAFFATLDAHNRYAVLFRIQTAKKAETRARRIAQFVAMLAKHEKLYP